MRKKSWGGQLCVLLSPFGAVAVPCFQHPELERWAGKSKAMAVLHTPASIPGGCHTALCGYHPGEVLILTQRRSYRKTEQRMDDPSGHKRCLISTCSECPAVPTALEQTHQEKNKIKHLLWLLLLPRLYFQTGFQEYLFPWSTSPVKSPKLRFHPYI